MIWFKRFVYAFSLAMCATCALAAEDQPDAPRAIPADNMAYPVLIEVPLASNPKLSKYGTGFDLRLPKQTYLITAKHGIFVKDTNTLLGPRALLTSYGIGREINSISRRSLNWR